MIRNNRILCHLNPTLVSQEIDKLYCWCVWGD